MSAEEAIARIQRFSEAHALPLNTFLIQDIRSGVVPPAQVPTAPVALKILLSCYKVFCSSKALATMSTQSAKTVEGLRRAGYVFASNGGSKRVVSENGESGRRILGFEAPPDRRAAALNLTKRQRNAYMAGRRDPLTGMTRDMEIDHRQPVEASARLGEVYPDLTQGLIDAGEADLYYQPLSKSTNIAKRGACHNCMNGEVIRIPAWAEHLEKITGLKFKRFFTDNLEHNAATGAPGCAGCPFFDHTLFMGQDFRNR